MAQRLILDPARPDSLFTAAQKINEAFDEFESDSWVTTERIADKSVTFEKMADLTTIPVGEWNVVFNSVDKSIMFMRNAAGIPYRKTDDAFNGKHTNTKKGGNGLELIQEETWLLNESIDLNETIDLSATYEGADDWFVMVDDLWGTTHEIKYYNRIAEFESNPIDIRKVHQVFASLFNWQETKASGQTVTLAISFAADGVNFGNYVNVNKNSQASILSNLVDVSKAGFKYRVRLATNNLDTTPSVQSLSYELTSTHLMKLMNNGTLKLKNETVINAVETL